MKHNHKHTKKSKISVGILIVVFGSLWLLKNLGLLIDPLAHYLFSWQALLICIGFIGLFCKNKPNLGGLILIIIGGAFIATDFINLPIDAFHLIIPIIIITIGIFIIFKKFQHPSEHFKTHFQNSCSVDLDTIDEVNIFGGRKSSYDTQNFKGGSSVSIFGGSEIDLSNANLAPGTNVLESISIFGGSAIIIPKDWNVKLEVVGIMGGFSDKRFKSTNIVTDASKTLVIKGIAIFGGGELKTL